MFYLLLDVTHDYNRLPGPIRPAIVRAANAGGKA
jgi:hypothetical protein